MAVIYQRFQLYAVRWPQGRLHELEDAIQRSVIEFPSYVVCRCVLAHLYVQLDREGDAREAFESLAVSGFAELPKNDEWVFGTALLADVAGFLRDRRRADRLYDLLLPYHARNAVSAPDVCIGAVARSLGVLAETLGRLDDAARHFEDALAMNARTWPRRRSTTRACSSSTVSWVAEPVPLSSSQRASKRRASSTLRGW